MLIKYEDNIIFIKVFDVLIVSKIIIISNNINYTLPNGDIRKIKVKTKKSKLILVKDAIQVITSLDFTKIE